MNASIGEIVYIIGLIVSAIIRGVYGRQHKRLNKVSTYGENPSVLIFMALWGMSQGAALFCIFSSWLDFADYTLPAYIDFCGVAVFIVSVAMLLKAHTDLGRNFSPFLEIMEDHILITTGVFSRIRHPMYTAHLLWGIGQALLIHNWLGGFTAFAVILPLFALRIPREEKMLLNRFGNEYREYMGRTGCFIPPLRFRRIDVDNGYR